MQNKGAIKFLIYTLIIVALYQLSFTFVALKIKGDAKEYSGGNYAKEVHYLDSMQNQKVYNLLVKNFTLKECLDRQINLGLDLQGGMNIMLQVNVPSLVRELSNSSIDPVFNQAFNEALTDFQAGKGDFIDLLQIKFEKLVPNNKYGLAAIFANSPQLRGVVDFSKTNEEIIAVLKDQSKSSIDNIFNVLRTRIDRFGVTQPNIQQIEGKRGRILVELPGIKDERRVQKLLEQSAALDFYLTYEASEIWPILERIDMKAAEILAAKQNKKDTSNVVVDTNQSLLQNVDTSKTLLDTTKINEDINKQPLLSRIYPAIDQNKTLFQVHLLDLFKQKIQLR
jgi:SecD/SecF fusion protein